MDSILTGRWARLEPLGVEHREGLRAAADDERIWVHTLVVARGPELDRWGDRRDAVLEALHVAASAGAWEVLRSERGLTVDEAGAVLVITMANLLDGPPSAPGVERPGGRYA